MTVAVPPENIDAFLEMSRLKNVESTCLGNSPIPGVFSVLYTRKAGGASGSRLFAQRASPHGTALLVDPACNPPRADLSKAPSIYDSC